MRRIMQHKDSLQLSVDYATQGAKARLLNQIDDNWQVIKSNLLNFTVLKLLNDNHSAIELLELIGEDTEEEKHL